MVLDEKCTARNFCELEKRVTIYFAKSLFFFFKQIWKFGLSEVYVNSKIWHRN